MILYYSSEFKITKTTRLLNNLVQAVEIEFILGMFRKALRVLCLQAMISLHFLEETEYYRKEDSSNADQAERHHSDMGITQNVQRYNQVQPGGARLVKKSCEEN